MSETITLSGVPETMLQTLYARAKETKTRRAIVDDKAVEVLGKLNYDFSLADRDSAMHNGVIARTIVLDRLTRDYLTQHPGAVVVNIASGLDTRCYRMTNYADVKQIFKVISGRFAHATVFVEIMSPMVVKRVKEKSIEGSQAKFTWGVKNGHTLAEKLPDFRFAAEHSLTEGMAEFSPIYRLLDRIPAVRGISNRIITLEK